MQQICQHIIPSKDFGGGEAIAFDLAKATCADETNHSSVWLPGKGAALDEAERNHIPFHLFNSDKLFSKSKLNSSCVNFGLGYRLRREMGNLVHTHAPFLYGSLSHGLRLSGKKRVVHVHTNFDAEKSSWAFRHPPEVIITCASFIEPHVRQSLPAGSRENQRIEVVRNSVDTAQYSPGDKLKTKYQLGFPHDMPLLLMLANITPNKGQATAIRAVADLRDQGIKVACCLAGIDRDPTKVNEAEIKSLINDLQLHEEVHLLGFRSDSSDLLRAADILLLPSTTEGLPLSILEAQASKTVVAASPVGGIPEVIEDGKTGYLINADDHLGYADKIKRLLDNPQHYEDICESAYNQCISNHQWSTYQDRIFTIYSELSE